MLKFIHKLNSIRILKGLQYKSGLFGASKKNVKTGYDKAWIRDNVYEALGFYEIKDYKTAKKTIQAIFDILRKHEYKIDWAIKERPDSHYKYIHARFCPYTYEEFYEPWGNMQNDAIGAFLFIVSKLNEKINIIRDSKDKEILQKLVFYLNSIEFWHDLDNGIWEDDEEIHASSIGACVAGLKAIREIVFVPKILITKGEKALDKMLPRESYRKSVDLALLTLIYPYNIVSVQQRALILKNVEKYLVRERGVIRNIDDWYYNENGEAEWVMGFPWLAKIYKNLGNKKKYEYYLKKTHHSMNWKGELPELYFANTNKYNDNIPLGWSQAMYLAAIV